MPVLLAPLYIEAHAMDGKLYTDVVEALAMVRYELES